MKKVIMSIFALVMFTGCLSLPVSVAPSNVPLAPNSYTEIGPTSGRGVGVIVFGIPLSEPYPCKSAVERAIEGSNADALVGITTDVTQINAGIIAVVITSVNATAVKVNK